MAKIIIFECKPDGRRKLSLPKIKCKQNIVTVAQERILRIEDAKEGIGEAEDRIEGAEKIIEDALKQEDGGSLKIDDGKITRLTSAASIFNLLNVSAIA